MGCTIYINQNKNEAKIHAYNCGYLMKFKGANRDSCEEFDSYEEAEEWADDNLDDYYVTDCSVCSPEEE